ncbi:MAG: glutamine--fructose-6-phosphate transaminase (isomerizing) [Deltaproteobacteria bacterium]|nr:glutamine--fructose-6-phosphate transaminase (isomerizing) [Deltaproteobacteria bacterium]
MCGIVGYIGDQRAEPILIDGLKKLEYRGYDSAGVAFIDDGAFHVVRAKGKLSCLIDKLKNMGSHSTIGIGHTRWATHGKPDEINAHPHHSRDVVLVHNGIIENYNTLKSEMIKKGHKIISETDTEVICHLIQDHLDQDMPFLKALISSLKKLNGAYSLVILNRNNPDHIYLARKGSPLVVGLGEGGNFVASDIPALLAHTRDVTFVEDNEIAVVSRERALFYNLSGDPVNKEIKKITWTASQAEKGGYKHFMLKEIMEQPRVLADTLLGRVDLEGLSVNLGEAGALLETMVREPEFRLKIVACGTSWHAGLVGKYWIEDLAKVLVGVELSSEFRYRQPLVTPKTLVVAISQSGETADTLAAIRESKRLGARVLSICNVVESSIPRESDATIYTHAGPEIGVASTKAFTTQMAVLYMLAIKLALEKNLLSDHEASQKIQALIEMPKLIEKTLGDLKPIMRMTERLRNKKHCYYIGRGIEYPIVLEGALKLKEISYIHAEGFAGGELKHGPIALIEEKVPVIAVVLKGQLYDKMVSNILEVKSRGAMVLALVNAEDKDIQSHFDEILHIPYADPDLNPFLTIIPLQLLAYYVAVDRGTDVDQPRNLAKSVTVE